MAEQTSKVKIMVEARGTKKAAKDIESVGRQQTRLGQASASAGRQFSAQASGLGGLVSAYAGAAATIFALSAAFDALNRAARAEQTLAGVNALANAVGESGPEVLDMIQRITKGQLSLVQSAELANLALSSGFSTEQLEGFTDVAMRASRALGRDLTDSFQRLVRGAVKLEPELLDELGIFTRIEPAAEAYAASVGKVASQLTRFEKRQAFANAVSEEGARKYKDIDIEADTAAQSLEKLAATVSDLATEIGGTIANALAPLAEALTSPVAAIGLMGVLIRTVFGTAMREASQRLAGFNANLRTSTDNLQDNLSSTRRIGKANLAFSDSMKEVNLNVARATAENDAEFKSLTKKAKAQTITTSETRRYNKIVAQEIALLKREKIALEESGKSTKAASARIALLQRRITAFTTAQTAANARLRAFGPIARTAGAAAIGLGKALGIAGKAALGALSWISLIISYLSILIAVGATVLEAFGWLDPVIEKLTQAVRFFKELLGVTKEARQASAAAKSLDIGVEKDAKFEARLKVNENLRIDTERRIAARTLRIQEARVRSEDQNLSRFRRRVAERDLRNLEAAQKRDQRTIDPNRQLKRSISGGDVRSAFQSVIKDAGAAGIGSSEAFVTAFAKKLKVNLDTNPELKAAIEKMGKQFAGESGGSLRGREIFAKATGMTLESANKLLVAEEGALRFSNDAIKNERTALQTMRARFKTQQEFNKLSIEARARKHEEEKIETSLLQTQQLQANLIEAMRSGSATLEQLEQKRGAMVAKITKLKKEESQRAKDIASAAQTDLDANNKNIEAQMAILKARKQIMETYSAEIKASSQLSKMNILVSKNNVDNFDLTVKKSEQEASQLQQLQKMYDLGREDLATQRAGGKEAEKLNDIQKQRAALARTAELAIVGQFQKIVEESQKLEKSLDKQTLAYKNQITLLKQQNALQDADRALKLSEQRIKSEQKALANSLKTLEAERNLAKVRAEGADLARQGANQRASDIAAEFGDLLSPGKQRALELRIARSDLEALRLSIEAQKDTIRERAKLEKASLEKQQKELQAQLGGKEGGGLIAKRFAAQAALDKAKIASDKSTRDLQIKQTEAQVKLLDKQLKGFESHVEGMARILAADRVARQEVIEGDKFAKGGRTVEQERTARMGDEVRLGQIDDATNDINAIIADLADDNAGLLGTLKKMKSQSTEIATLQEKNVGGKRSAAEADARLKAQEALADIQLKIKNNATITATELQKLTNELNEAGISTKNLAAAFADADNEMLQIAKDVASSLSEGIGQGLRDLNAAMIEGTLTMENFKEGFKETFLNIAKDIQAKIFDRTVVKPVENFINEKVLGAFGFGPDKKIEDALVASTGGTAMLVTMAPSVAAANPTKILKDQCDAAALKVEDLGAGADTGGNFLTDMFSKVGTVLGDFGSALLEAGRGVFDFVGNLFSSLGGSGGGGGFFSGIFGGIGDFFSGIFGGGGASVAPTVGVPVSPSILPPTIGFAAHGGLIKRMAAGGMLRDRIPTLLEPGEFVIRKPMAKAIGGPALNAMNAHGTMGGTQNVVVNMHNEGTAQETTQSPSVQVTPETIIVDIVTRDLKNNGPIRQGIRGAM